MSLPEIVSMISVLVSGGGDTTRGAILHMWRLLLEHPEQLAAVQADPSLLDAAFHETLRHSSPVGGMARSTNREVVLHGVTIPAGAWVELVNFSANHDERVFPEPEAFDISRPELFTGRRSSEATASTACSATWGSGSAPISARAHGWPTKRR